MSVKVKLIIPAAGYGTRVGKPVAKELMPDEQGLPLIQWWLDRAREIDADVHLITRKEKAVLVDFVQSYCDSLILTYSVQYIESSREWPDTVLQSEPFWSNKNILVLPDTRYKPISSLSEISNLLNEKAVVAGLFDVDDPAKWGIVRRSAEHNWICDKPIDCSFTEIAQAWGLLGFRSASGEKLFSGILQSYFDKRWQTLPSSFGCVQLAGFKDLTR
jgi:dTDP-glucose pyrophosphorylase